MALREYRIVGPPGTGKTTWLGGQVARVVNAKGPDSVLVTSFTRAAAKEALSRGLPIADSRVGTLHALCYRALGRPTIAESKASEWNALFPSIALSGARGALDEPATEAASNSNGDELLMTVNRLRAMLIPEEHWPDMARSFGRRWEDWKKQQGYSDFTDLLVDGLEELVTPPQGADVLFMDEAQDATPLQWALIRQWGASCEYLYVVGDADQLLYNWLGADVENMMGPVHSEKVLDQSYRVPQAVVEKADAWIQTVSRRNPTAYKPRDGEPGYVKHERQFKWQQPDGIIKRIEELTSTGETVMVLGSCAYMLKPLLGALKEDGTPYHNPYRVNRGDWNPLGRKAGTSMTDRLSAFLRPNIELFGENARFWTYEDVFLFTSAMKSAKGLKRGAKTKLAGMDAVDRVRTEADITWLLENVFEEQAFAKAFDLDLQWYLESLNAAKRKAVEYPARVLAASGWEALIKTPKIIVGTIHSVKGGEADHVIVYPDLSPAGYRQWGQHGSSRDAVIRQFYVALTRARRGVTICGQAGSMSVPLWREQ